jgi:hypothetical protein
MCAWLGRERGICLTAVERELGFVEFHCDAHGFLAATTPKATVVCRCGKVARTLRNGRVVTPVTLKPTQAQARSLNEAGHPNIQACGDCGADFRGTDLLHRHRVGRGSKRRCMTADEMRAKGWRRDEKGRWRRPRDTGYVHSSGGHRPASPGQNRSGRAAPYPEPSGPSERSCKP